MGQETEKTRRKRDVEGQEIETTEKRDVEGQEVTKDQAKRWYGYGYGGYGLGYGGFYRPYGYGYWGKRDVETQATRSKRDVEGQEVTKDQAKRWYGVGMGYHPYAYSPYGYGYWGKRDVEAQQETKKTRSHKRSSKEMVRLWIWWIRSRLWWILSSIRIRILGQKASRLSQVRRRRSR